MSHPARQSGGEGKGYLYALGGIFLVSTNFVTAKYSLSGFEPVTFSFVWTAFSSLYSFLIVLAVGRKRQLKLPAADRERVGMLGLFTGLGMIWSWTALALLDPSFKAFLVRFVPMITIIFGAVFLGEKLRPREIAAMLVMLGGGLLSTLGDWRAVSTGVFFALLSIISVSCQLFIAKTRASTVHPTVLVFYRSALACSVILAWGLLRGLDFRVETRYWLVAALGALLGPCLSHLLTFRSLKYLELARASMISNIQPLFVIPMAWLFLGYFPTRTQLGGGIVILAGASWLFLAHLSKRKITPAVPRPEEAKITAGAPKKKEKRRRETR